MNKRPLLSAGWIGFLVCCFLALSTGNAGAMTLEGDGGLPYFTQGDVVKVGGVAFGVPLTVKTYDGVVVDTPNATPECTATLDDLPPGYYEVSNGSTTLPFVITYARKPLASVVSLDAHLSDDWVYNPRYSATVPMARIWDARTPDIFKKDLTIAEHSGAYYLRERFRWGDFEPKPGKWDDTIYNYYYVPELKAGFKVIPAVEGLAPWAEAVPGKGAGPPKQDAWKKLFADLSSRYGQQISTWQVWNEPNPNGISGQSFPGGATPAKYIESYAVGARAGVDASGGKLKLVLGGSGITDTPWNSEIIKEGVMKYMDIFDIHLYGTEPFTLEPAMKEVLKDLDQVHFTGPIMATEFDVTPGFGIPKPKGPAPAVETAADKLAQMYVLWFAMDKRTRDGTLFKFDERDYVVFPSKMGIARVDYSPKPDLAAMNIVAHRLAGASFVKTICDGSTGPKISMQLIKDSDGKTFGTVYAQGEGNSITFHTDAPELTLLSAPGGAPVKVRTLDGVAVLPLPNERFFYIDGLTTIDACKPLVELVPAATADKGPVKLVFRNPLSKPIDLKVKLTGSKDLSLPAEAGMILSLKGSEEKEVSLNGTAPATGESFSVVLDEAHSGFHAEVLLAIVPSK